MVRVSIIVVAHGIFRWPSSRRDEMAIRSVLVCRGLWRLQGSYVSLAGSPEPLVAGGRSARAHPSAIDVSRPRVRLKPREGGNGLCGWNGGQGVLFGLDIDGGRRIHLVGVLAVVEVLAVHLRVLSDTALPSLAADEGAAHRTGEDAAGGEDDRSGEDDPAAPFEMGYEEEDVDEKGEQGDQQRGQQQDEQAQQVARGVRGSMEVSSGRQAKADEGQKGGDRMNDQERRERMADRCRQVEVTVCVGVSKGAVPRIYIDGFNISHAVYWSQTYNDLTVLVAYGEGAASVPATPAKDAKGDVVVRGQRDALDDRGREDGEQQQGEGSKQQDGQRRCWFQQHSGGTDGGPRSIAGR